MMSLMSHVRDNYRYPYQLIPNQTSAGTSGSHGSDFVTRFRKGPFRYSNSAAKTTEKSRSRSGNTGFRPKADPVKSGFGSPATSVQMLFFLFNLTLNLMGFSGGTVLNLFWWCYMVSNC